MNWYKNLKIKGKLLLSFMLILSLAMAAGTCAIFEMCNINMHYTEAMNLTNERIGYIFEAKDNLSRARMIMREIFYPENTQRDLNRLSAEMETEMDILTRRLTSLHDVADEAVMAKVELVLPKVEQFRNDSLVTIGLLLDNDHISIRYPDYLEALIMAQDRTMNIANTYALEMSNIINDLSDIELEAVRELTEYEGLLARNAMMLSIGLFILMVALTLAIALYLPKHISKPLTLLSTFMKKASTTGDLSLRPEDLEIIGEYAQINDEIGETIASCASFVGHVTKVSEELKIVAGGDLTIEIEPISDVDTMGISLLNVVGSLNETLEEIQRSTEQVSMGSRQVAEGAQSLAQGATEQAASIQELSGSISDLAERTRENAETADRTSKLSGIIKENAERGSRQMDEMMHAVLEINEASNSISKIIKTIDDIAFQTNILALNAAVEAARAGQHGKGFAVVAEEVRNLAAKSAEAAKETGVMIQNSMEKAEFGSCKAGETATSLSEIVSGINESSNLIAEIARASEIQSAEIAQINTGIEQVSHVVQQNSATAQQSAAVSEQMSSQSSMLNELTAHFQLKEGKGAYTDLAEYKETMTKSLPGRKARKPKFAADRDNTNNKHAV